MKCYAGDEPRIEVNAKFVESNKFKINTEAAKKITYSDSFFGFDIEVAITVLPYEDCKHVFNDKFKEKIIKGEYKHLHTKDVMEVAQDFLDYMVFAWSKAIDERGISASRSIDKLGAWMEILSRPDVAEVLHDDDLYNPYGRPALRNACGMLGIDCPDYL